MGTSLLGQHDPGHRKRDEGFVAGVCALTIAGESTMARDQGIGVFHSPPSGKHIKAFGNDHASVDFH